jgi:hypothetical protein
MAARFSRVTMAFLDLIAQLQQHAKPPATTSIGTNTREGIGNVMMLPQRNVERKSSVLVCSGDDPSALRNVQP